ncbi:Fanconi-associated nuclease 1 [Fasciola gigantica]|uniref:Fanconi-associated nuclease n=1 Tax=Fasciola gigantica TaxID=46835 RepID=A0A504YUA0_FASGI|nr:Fanconi-associated nuclease 1 [Fasciola gigantica]
MKDLRQYFTFPDQISLPGRSDASENVTADVHNVSVQSDEDYVSSDSAPYVVRSLEDAIQLVLTDSIFKQALTDADQIFLSRFRELSEPAKLICSRLFGRVQRIFRKTDLSRIVEANLDEYMSELVSAGLFSATIDGVQCDTILKALNRQELQNLSSRYNIRNHKKLKMSELIATLLKISTGSASNCFFGKDLCPEARFRKHLHQVLGTCWCIESKRMRLLSGVLWLSGMGSDMAFGSPQRSKTIESQLKTEFYHMMLVRRGEIVYPSFQTTKKTTVYRSPDELQQYLDFFDCQLKLEYTVAEKQFDTATESFNSMRNHLLRLITDPSHLRTDVAGFLRRFTLPYRAFRILLIGIDLLERQKRYQDAVTLIRQVLFSDDGGYCTKASGTSASGSCPLDNLGPCRVGRLLIRLLVDQGSHLKQPKLALDAVRNFLRIGNNMKDGISACPCIRAGLRLELQEQLSKTVDILPGLKLPNDRKDVGLKPPKRRRSAVPSAEKENSNCDFSVVHIPDLVPDLLQAPKVEIRAPVNASSKDLGAHRPHYLWFENSESQSLPDESSSQSRSNQKDDTDTFLLTVEQWTLRYYTSRLGYEYGKYFVYLSHSGDYL